VLLLLLLLVLQVELRLIAHLSEDEVLCSTLCKEGQDPFTAMACMWQKCPIDQVCSCERLLNKGIPAVWMLCSLVLRNPANTESRV
jgi:DNA polymerase I-like protein with 3'-5' exonuclease and polymerase domains